MNKNIKKSLCILLSMLTVAFSASFAFGGQSDSQPFAKGTASCERFRIPAMVTLPDGSVVTSADIRYGGGWDSPANIDIGVQVSKDAGKNWSDINVVNYFGDFENGNSVDAVPKSASFIDSALLRSSEGTIFLVCDACPAYIGSAAARNNGSGLIEGKIILCDKTTEDGAESGEMTKAKYPYYIGEFDKGFAPVLKFSDSSVYDGYYVDKEFNLYRDNDGSKENVIVSVFDKDGNKIRRAVQANVFYAASPVKIYPTFYTWLRKSENGGKSWSEPFILNAQIGAKGFTGVCPGQGFAFKFGGKERLAFAVYDTNDGSEKTSVIYSDDNGLTWARGEKITAKGYAKKTSETQLIQLDDKTIRAYSRNRGRYIGYADSTDGGKTWSKHYQDGGLKYCSDCMVSFINYSKEIDGKRVVLASYPTTAPRKLGVLKVGLVGDDNRITWQYEYKLSDSDKANSFNYSCLGELPDGSVAILYENDWTEISYRVIPFEELVSAETKVSTFKLFWQNVLTAFLKIAANF